jgi:hypothetical protein
MKEKKHNHFVTHLSFTPGQYSPGDVSYIQWLKNRLDDWMFFTKVNNPTYLLIQALTYECMKESPYHWLSIGPRVKGIG